MARERTRRLAAVWFADIVGYTALSARHEDAALAVVDEFQAAARAATEGAGGRIVKFVGDAALVTFESADAALRAALALRERFALAPTALEYGCELRIGMHLGEVVEAEDGDLYGDGVNLASRVQGKAAPGEIVATQTVADLVRGRTEFELDPMASRRRLKGLGLTKLFVVRAAGEPPPPPRRISKDRAIAVGVTGGVVAFVGLIIGVGFGNPFDDGAEAETDDGVFLDAHVELNIGVDQYFAGEHASALRTLERFAEPPLRETPEAEPALRYLARTYVELDSLDRAREAVEELVDGEPPMELMIPTAESASLIDVYYQVRTDARRVTAGTPVEGVIVFDLRFVSDVEDPNLAEVGPTVSQMLVSELETHGVAVRYPWEVMLGYPEEVAYRFFDERVLSSGPVPVSHAMFGRVAVREGQLSISARVYEMATGGIVVSETLTGVWPDALFDLVEQLGSRIGRGLADVG